MHFLTVFLFVFAILSLDFTDTCAQDFVPSTYVSTSSTSTDADQSQAARLTEMPTCGAAGAQFPHPFAPLGVYGAHVIKPGKWLTAYTYGHMAMSGNLIGTDSVSTDELLKLYPVVPVSMDEGRLRGNRLFIEGGVPIYQDLDGPQPATTWMVRGMEIPFLAEFKPSSSLATPSHD